MRVGVDTGGTFTDLVTSKGEVRKVPSTPTDPAVAVETATSGAVPQGKLTNLAHGTTVATNALLEGATAVVTLVCTMGTEDMIEIARQDRPSLYDGSVRRADPIVDRDHRIGISGRLAADGSEVAAVADLDRLVIPAGTESVAVALLHSDLDEAHERTVTAAVEAAGFDVCCSSDVSPEFREYERTITTVINAALRPICRGYLSAVEELSEHVTVMSSSGGLLDIEVASELPAALLLSGPAGGVGAAAEASVAAGFADAVTFDMGGTSTDVCLVRDGSPEPAGSRRVAGYDLRFPSLDIHTIGAGGGSIAWIDDGGALRVGPRSAGARPGPACYGHGGSEPTVTDAQLLTGRIDPTARFGDLVLSVEAARRAFERTGIDPHGVIEVVNTNMEGAIRAVTVERGVDPTDLALVAFGGAGPLHACDLAEALDMAAVVIPARAGVLSAVGLLAAPMRREVVRSWPTPADHEGLEATTEELREEARLLLAGDEGGEVEVEVSYECRYRGQSHELRVPSIAAFPAEHERRNGFSRPGELIEVVAVRAAATQPTRTKLTDFPEPAVRNGGVGPMVLPEPDCTIWVPQGWMAEPGPVGSLVLTRSP